MTTAHCLTSALEPKLGASSPEASKTAALEAYDDDATVGFLGERLRTLGKESNVYVGSRPFAHRCPFDWDVT